MSSAPLSTQAMRDDYAAARCNTAEFVTTTFYGYAGAMYVERHTLAAWQAFDRVMARHGYRFREPAGGTYNCREIAGSGSYSLHSYGLALDLNPSTNGPQGTSTTDQPAAFRADVKAITANGRRVFDWGGDWSPGSRDPMHWQIGATRADLSHGVVDPNGDDGGDTTPTEEDNMLPLRHGDGTGDRTHKRQDVAALQSMLRNDLGANLEVDGVYGDDTARAVRNKIDDSDGDGESVNGKRYARLIRSIAQRWAGGAS